MLGCHALVSAAGAPAGAGPVLNACGHLECWMHFCGACDRQRSFHGRLRGLFTAFRSLADAKLENCLVYATKSTALQATYLVTLLNAAQPPLPALNGFSSLYVMTKSPIAATSAGKDLVQHKQPLPLHIRYESTYGTKGIAMPDVSSHLGNASPMLSVSLHYLTMAKSG